MNTWVIYVAGISKKNYDIGKQQGTWGIKKLVKNSQFTNVEAGDDVIFVHNLTRPKNVFPDRVSGFPRVNINNFKNFEGLATQVIFAKVTKNYNYSNEVIWTDETYPYRFSFEIKEIQENVLFTAREVGESLIKSSLSSFHLKGDVALTVAEASSVSDKIQIVNDSYYAIEGGASYKIHKKIERNRKIVESKKIEFLEQHGKLFCEICTFSFEETYGTALNRSSIECHHINPLAENGKKETRLSDLVLLCPNCHRVLHQHNPCLDVNTLIESIKNSHST